VLSRDSHGCSTVDVAAIAVAVAAANVAPVDVAAAVAAAAGCTHVAAVDNIMLLPLWRRCPLCFDCRGGSMRRMRDMALYWP